MFFFLSDGSQLIDGLIDGWMDGWMDRNDGLKAINNQKKKIVF